jgi:hypothetical protein
VTKFERVVKGAVTAIAEVEVNHKRLGSCGGRLLNDIHGTTLLLEEMYV